MLRPLYRIIPFVLTDGGIYHREVYFTSTDVVLIEHFRRAALEAFGYEGYVVKRGGYSYVAKLRGHRYVEHLLAVMPSLTCKNIKTALLA